jgi:hypothetical protein
MRREGGEVMRRGGRGVMGREGQGHVTACAGSTGPLAFGEAAAPWGWTALSGVLVTRQGTEWAAAGADGPRVRARVESRDCRPGARGGKPYVDMVE